MTRRILTFDAPRRFISGTVGMPGERTFYLQVAQGSELATVSLEKAQVALLADRLDELLDEAGASSATHSDDNEPLDVPFEEDFRVGALAMGWDPTLGRVVAEAHALMEGREPAELGDDDDGAADTLRIILEPAMCRAFIRRSRALVAAGRPPCPFCLQPLDPSGHICPRANGYRRRP
ncbi:MAG: DUF3090 family protein [Actinobacteria bacterium]|nr:DUF3090 family protein [Actinomycetota bacterium]